MSPRNAVITGLFSLTLLVGGLLFVDGAARDAKEGLKRYPAHETLAREKSRTVSMPSSAAEYLPGFLVVNKELLLYGGIALFGIVMMALAISKASAKSQDKTDKLVELLRQEKERAENLARLKSEFLNQVSHELRTPLAVIIGYIECITDGLYGEIQEKHQEILQIVAKQSGHLKNMIDQILIYSRLEAKKQPVRIEELDLNRIATELKETFDFLCRQKGLTLHWELATEPVFARTDGERVREVLSNLLQNAIKYTSQGSITVGLRRVTVPDSIVIDVADTGMGIPERYLSTIFEPFMQVHKTSSVNSKGGIGLGLSIVKKHLEQLRGSITVESEPGKGSTFRIVLPRLYNETAVRRQKFLDLVKRPFSISKGPQAAHLPARNRGKDLDPTNRAIG